MRHEQQSIEHYHDLLLAGGELVHRDVIAIEEHYTQSVMFIDDDPLVREHPIQYVQVSDDRFRQYVISLDPIHKGMQKRPVSVPIIAIIHPLWREFDIGW